jgi:hypothetical protein
VEEALNFTLLAGTGVADYNGEARPAITAALNSPNAVAWDVRRGGWLIADTSNCR